MHNLQDGKKHGRSSIVAQQIESDKQETWRNQQKE
jgi:hypothetical protein